MTVNLTSMTDLYDFYNQHIIAYRAYNTIIPYTIPPASRPVSRQRITDRTRVSTLSQADKELVDTFLDRLVQFSEVSFRITCNLN